VVLHHDVKPHPPQQPKKHFNSSHSCQMYEMDRHFENNLIPIDFKTKI
jgi:hypothetical protein